MNFTKVFLKIVATFQIVLQQLGRISRRWIWRLGYDFDRSQLAKRKREPHRNAAVNFAKQDYGSTEWRCDTYHATHNTVPQAFIRNKKGENWLRFVQCNYLVSKCSTRYGKFQSRTAGWVWRASMARRWFCTVQLFLRRSLGITILKKTPLQLKCALRKKYSETTWPV